MDVDKFKLDEEEELLIAGDESKVGVEEELVVFVGLILVLTAGSKSAME